MVNKVEKKESKRAETKERKSERERERERERKRERDPAKFFNLEFSNKFSLYSKRPLDLNLPFFR